MLSLGRFDLVFCFGLLYHLENPLLAIRHLRAMTEKVLLVEGVIFPGDEPTMGLVDEAPSEDQRASITLRFIPRKRVYKRCFTVPDFDSFTALPRRLSTLAISNGRIPKIRTMLAASHELITSSQLEVVPQPSTPIQPWDAENVAANTSSAEALRGFSQKRLWKSEKS